MSSIRTRVGLVPRLPGNESTWFPACMGMRLNQSVLITKKWICTYVIAMLLRRRQTTLESWLILVVHIVWFWGSQLQFQVTPHWLQFNCLWKGPGTCSASSFQYWPLVGQHWDLKMITLVLWITFPVRMPNVALRLVNMEILITLVTQTSTSFTVWWCQLCCPQLYYWIRSTIQKF